MTAALNASSLKIAIVTSRFNEVITDKLTEGAILGLRQLGLAEDQLTQISVPGAFEIPLAAKILLEKKPDLDAVITIGCVIRGETPHFDQVVAGVTSGVARVALDAGKPVVYGVLTTDTVEQAMNRAGLKAGNKGWEAALTAVEMVNLLNGI